MHVKVLENGLRLLALLQSPKDVVRWVAKDHRIRIKRDQAAARMGRGSDREEKQKQRLNESHCLDLPPGWLEPVSSISQTSHRARASAFERQDNLRSFEYSACRTRR